MQSLCSQLKQRTVLPVFAHCQGRMWEGLRWPGLVSPGHLIQGLACRVTPHPPFCSSDANRRASVQEVQGDSVGFTAAREIVLKRRASAASEISKTVKINLFRM